MSENVGVGGDNQGRVGREGEERQESEEVMTAMGAEGELPSAVGIGGSVGEGGWKPVGERDRGDPKSARREAMEGEDGGVSGLRCAKY